ncbi:MAG: GDP-mannose 4,6-dehydratase [Planctomycetes bacterium]|nr:GDP-mannose 4,6-dehydratase [Planctomycetota bacterium]
MPQTPTHAGRRALITGITGQDGSYLAELLLAKGYEVWGLARYSSSGNTWRIDQLRSGADGTGANGAGADGASGRLRLRYGDLADGTSLRSIVHEAQPEEIYNLGAQSHVQVSFEMASYTTDVTGTGAVRLLEAARELAPRARFYQASSSEMFGQPRESPQRETTPFHPRSPYGAAKALAFHAARNFREAYGMHVVNGILFNHESPRRGPEFVTRKISLAAARIAAGRQQRLTLGNLDARRDWGFAGDYVEAMWQMMQLETADDFVVATGVSHSVREFCELAFAAVGLPLIWRGQGKDEQGVSADGRVLVTLDPALLRPAEVERLVGDSSKARAAWGWKPTVSLEQLATMMVQSDLAEVSHGERSV